MTTAVGSAVPTTTSPNGPITADQAEPLWVQAMQHIQVQIEAGDLPAGSRLPAERELCLRLGISRVTLRKALAGLVERGALRPSHGRGWYVAAPTVRGEWPNTLESFTETARRMGLVPTSVVVSSQVVHASLDLAETLRVAPGTAVYVLERIRLLDGVPTAFDRTSLPLHLAPEIETTDFATESLYAYLAVNGVHPVRAESTIEARQADPLLAERLDLVPGAPVLVLDQVAVDVGGRPVLASVVQYSGERYRLRTVFARSGG
jgi:GntR family transcriptional regulator